MKRLMCFVVSFLVLCAVRTQELTLPLYFQADITLKARRTTENFFAKFHISKDSNFNIIASGYTNQNQEFFYKNGKLLDLNSNSCVPPEEVPPFLDLVKVIKTAQKIPSHTKSYDIELNKCKENYTKWSIVYAGEVFALCTLQKNEIFTKIKIISQNFIAIIENFTYDQHPKKLLNNPNIEKCLENKDSSYHYSNNEKFHMVSTLSDINKIEDEKAWFEKESYCDLYWIKDETKCNQISSKISKNKKDCVFFHGAGERDIGDHVNELKSYWGNVNDFTPQCNRRIYVRRDTKNHGWDYIPNQKEYCRVATLNQTDNVIRNKIIFAHSMGSLILSAAVQNGFCQIDSSTTTWYHIAGPFGGTKVVSWLMELCQGNTTGISNEILKAIAELFDYCIKGQKKVYDSYLSCEPNYPGLERLVHYAYTHVNGSLCGTSAYGLNSRYSVPLSVISTFADYGEKNDGFVAKSSCNKIAVERGVSFVGKSSANFYSAATNHADNTCRNSNGWWGDDRKPCDYFLNKF